MDRLLELFKDLGGTAVAVLSICVAYIIAQRILSARIPQGSKFVNLRKITLAFILLLGLLVILLTLPIGNELRGQILSFVGIIISAALALSATTLLGNALAAMMMRFVNHFQVGDFIRMEDCFGKVTNRGVFHTEIQTEDRNLQTIPNLYLATRPVKVIRPSGTILTGKVSLGYDVHRKVAEEALLKAAEQTELKNPFVFVKKLGDYSIEYQVNGLLEDVNSILSTKSNLLKAMLDQLHEVGVEIVSPSFMNQRAVTEVQFIPQKSNLKEKEDEEVEKMIFDKADLAEKLEKGQMDKSELKSRIEGLQSQVDKNEGDINLKNELEVHLEILAQLEDMEKDQKGKKDE